MAAPGRTAECVRVVENAKKSSIDYCASRLWAVLPPGRLTQNDSIPTAWLAQSPSPASLQHSQLDLQQACQDRFASEVSWITWDHHCLQIPAAAAAAAFQFLIAAVAVKSPWCLKIASHLWPFGLPSWRPSPSFSGSTASCCRILGQL